jgi:hypothetical protein
VEQTLEFGTLNWLDEVLIEAGIEHDPTILRSAVARERDTVNAILALTIAPSGLRSSCDNMARKRSRCSSASRACCSAAFRQVTSVAIPPTPMISPASSRIGDFTNR